MTDANGRFQLKTQNRGSIWFSFIGYKTVKAPVSPTMSVQLEQEVVRLFPETSGKLKASATLSSDVKAKALAEKKAAEEAAKAAAEAPAEAEATEAPAEEAPAAEAAAE